MNINDIVVSFKNHQLQHGLGGDPEQDELYKWKLVTDQIRHPDVYAVDFEISKKCTADEAQAEARKIRGLLDAFPAPVDSVRIVFSSGLIAYSPDKPEFVQIAGGQRTTFK